MIPKMCGLCEFVVPVFKQFSLKCSHTTSMDFPVATRLKLLFAPVLWNCAKIPLLCWHEVSNVLFCLIFLNMCSRVRCSFGSVMQLRKDSLCMFAHRFHISRNGGLLSRRNHYDTNCFFFLLIHSLQGRLFGFWVMGGHG